MDVPSLIQRAGGRPVFQDRLKVARTTVIGWEKDNRIPAARIAQISKTFGIPVEELLGLATGPREARAS